MERAFLIGAAVFLLLSSAHTLYALGAGRFRPARFNLLTMLCALALLSAYLYVRGEQVRACPLHTLFDLLVFLSWSILLLYVLIGPAYHLSLMGAFTAPLVLILLCAAAFLPWDAAAAPVPRRNAWVEFHAATSVIAYGAFALGGVSGWMYLVQERQLKGRRGSALLYSLPPIANLTTANQRLIFAGFLLLTLAFAAGFIAREPVDGLKFGASGLIWALYGLMLILRKIHVLTPKRHAAFSVAIFLLALVTLPGIHYLS